MKFFCNHYYTHRLVSATFQRLTILRVPNLGKILKNDNSEFFFNSFQHFKGDNSDFSNRGNISKNLNSEFFQSWQHLISCLRAQPSSCPVVAPLISGALSFTASFTFHSVFVDSIVNIPLPFNSQLINETALCGSLGFCCEISEELLAKAYSNQKSLM